MAASTRSPKVVRQAAAATCAVDDNTTFVQADPATFRALVQKLTGAAPPPATGTPTAVVANGLSPTPKQEDEAAAVTVAHPPPPPRRPKLQERRRAAPARLELSRPPHLTPASPLSPSFYYYHHAHAHHHGHGLMLHSPVSPMDAYAALAASPSPSLSLSSSPSMTPSPHSSSPASCGGVMLTREEEEREEKAIASKGFYLHASPRGDGADRPKLLPLFPVHSPRINELRRA